MSESTILKGSNVVVKVPQYFKERCVVRCTEADFGPSKKDNPMITTQWECCGIPNNTGSCDVEYKKGDQVYQISGLKPRPIWFTLTDNAVSFYREFWLLAHGHKKDDLDKWPGVDTTNPDKEFMDGLLMDAILTGSSQKERRILSPEEIEEKKAAGEEPIGEPILDGDGNEITRDTLHITMWLKLYKGEVMPF